MLVAFPDIKRNYYKLLSTKVMCRTFLTPIRRWKQTPMRVTNLTKRGSEEYYLAEGEEKSSLKCLLSERNLEQWRELWVVGLSQTRPSRAIFTFKLVWFWMGCSSCPRTRPVETCAGIVRFGLEGDRPLWNTQGQKSGLKAS